MVIKRIYKTGERPEVGDLITWDLHFILVERITYRGRNFCLNYLTTPKPAKVWYYLPAVAPLCKLVSRNGKDWATWL